MPCRDRRPVRMPPTADAYRVFGTYDRNEAGVMRCFPMLRDCNFHDVTSLEPTRTRFLFMCGSDAVLTTAQVSGARTPNAARRNAYFAVAGTSIQESGLPERKGAEQEVSTYQK